MEHDPFDPFCSCPECEKVLEEAGLLEKAPDHLEEAESFLLSHLAYLQRRGLPRQVEAYTALAQVRQAQALEQIAQLLKNGIPVESVK